MMYRNRNCFRLNIKSLMLQNLYPSSKSIESVSRAQIKLRYLKEVRLERICSQNILVNIQVKHRESKVQIFQEIAQLGRILIHFLSLVHFPWQILLVPLNHIGMTLSIFVFNKIIRNFLNKVTANKTRKELKQDLQTIQMIAGKLKLNNLKVIEEIPLTLQDSSRIPLLEELMAQLFIKQEDPDPNIFQFSLNQDQLQNEKFETEGEEEEWQLVNLKYNQIFKIEGSFYDFK